MCFACSRGLGFGVSELGSCVCARAREREKERTSEPERQTERERVQERERARERERERASERERERARARARARARERERQRARARERERARENEREGGRERERKRERERERKTSKHLEGKGGESNADQLRDAGDAHDARHAEQGAEHWCVLPEILLRVSETNRYTDIQITDCPGWGGAGGQRRGRDTWKYRWPKLKIRPMYMTKETDVYDKRDRCI